MLRIHFTSDDLVRVRIAHEPDPLWETRLSAQQLNLAGGPPVFREWRSRVLLALSAEARAYLRLTPPRGRTRGLPPAARGRQAFQAYHDQAIAPYWTALRRDVDIEIAARVRTLTSGGTAALLASVHPSVTWREPVLSVATGVDRDVRLDGRGLTFQPAFFCWRAPVWPADPDPAPVLVYPVPHRASWLRPPGVGKHERVLAALLGRTRAAALAALTHGGASTIELARHIGVSSPSASEHVSVLRAAGLVVSRRERNSMWHILTPLGRAVLDGGRVVLPVADPAGQRVASSPANSIA
ncbi:helix-turn-helix domain-containing protein [Myceligenerans pegani]|uniref:Helix-turn-helix transcriptional regulator n=1 Tax=Myceligenerans pegani TaxID=2776917 RepID=A0ABR9N1A7_9MICO|nr:helix-turn-helix domain-containing protein [Myceligenerans sp. TRM 65318]MBE1876863.1 helix-turn-helix transcriptional regulator [Myceligenerans sp. TRM 65318]MBE3019134.1 helix-turn-helix transcriptional regulator [Myceligenerans sp. TRM 65318]